MYIPIQFSDEVFKDIDIEGIKPIYQISNYGKVINKITGQQLSQQYTDDGYCRVGLATIDGRPIHFLVHRLVMLTFHPIENPEAFEVNHMQGVKNDNHDLELEWTTGAENRAHAERLCLNHNFAENHSKAVFTNDQVKIICEDLAVGKPFEEIYKDIGETDCKDLRRSVECILKRKAWNSISKDYIFAEYRNMRNLFNDTQVHVICEMLSTGASYKDILIRLGYDILAMPQNDLQNFCDTISNIRSGRYYKEISKNYTLDSTKGRYDQKMSNTNVEKICRFLEDGMKAKEILAQFGITKENTESRQYDSLTHFISRIKNRKQFTDISSKYNF